MDHFTIGIGAAWLGLTILAAAFLGTEFILHEIHTYIRERRRPDGE
jgi:hypothetical protein